jgi:hypothetical protein
MQSIPNMAVDIQVFGKRLAVCDVQESVLFFKYKVWQISMMGQ